MRIHQLFSFSAIFLVFAIAFAPSAGAQTNSPYPASEEGTSLYVSGRRSDGTPLNARLADGSIVNGSQLPCAGCHQKSGLGSSEGGVTAPPVTWSALTQPRQSQQRDPYRSRSRIGQARPPYDADLFARAIREGRDSAGRTLESSMPRYELSTQDTDELIKHLQALSQHGAPGVTDHEIHLATVLGPNVSAENAAAIERVLVAFAKGKNSESRNESGRSRQGPYYQDTLNKSFRRWNLHVWRVTGPPSQWSEQLASHYARQPVFAIMSGRLESTAEPLDTFCRAERIPCVMPQTSIVPKETTGGYTLWLSSGAALEANLLIAHLRARPDRYSGNSKIVVEFQSTDVAFRSAAARYAEVLDEAGFTNTTLFAQPAGGARVDSSSKSAEQPEGGIETESASTALPSSAAVVVALVEPQRFDDARRTASDLDADLFVSGTSYGSDLVGEIPESERAWMIHPFKARDRVGPMIRRATAWLGRRDLPKPHTRAQLDTYLAALVTADALKHMRTNFSRDYFMERIEHGLDNLVYHSVYPRLSLGPGQRVSSKSGSILDLTPSPTPASGH